jgi:hypothetical protein
MSTLIGLLAAAFLFVVGVVAGVRAAAANHDIARRISMARRDDAVDDEAANGEFR